MAADKRVRDEGDEETALPRRRARSIDQRLAEGFRMLDASEVEDTGDDDEIDCLSSQSVSPRCRYERAGQ